MRGTEAGPKRVLPQHDNWKAYLWKISFIRDASMAQFVAVGCCKRTELEEMVKRALRLTKVHGSLWMRQAFGFDRMEWQRTGTISSPITRMTACYAASVDVFSCIGRYIVSRR